MMSDVRIGDLRRFDDMLYLVLELYHRGDDNDYGAIDIFKCFDMSGMRIVNMHRSFVAADKLVSRGG